MHLPVLRVPERPRAQPAPGGAHIYVHVPCTTPHPVATWDLSQVPGGAGKGRDHETSKERQAGARAGGQEVAWHLHSHFKGAPQGRELVMGRV